MKNIIFRFVDDLDLSSGFIRRAEFGLPWSHVEAVAPSGFYIGSRDNGGCLVRQPGYMKFAAEHFIAVACNEMQYDYVFRLFGRTDWEAL